MNRQSDRGADIDSDLQFGLLAQKRFLEKHPSLVPRPDNERKEDFTIGDGGPKMELKADRYLMIDRYSNYHLRGKFSVSCSGSVTSNIAIEVGQRRKPSMSKHKSGVHQAIKNRCEYFCYWMFTDDVEFWFRPEQLAAAAWAYYEKNKKSGIWVINRKRNCPDAFCILMPYKSNDIRSIIVSPPV